MAKLSQRLLFEEFQSCVCLFPNIYISHLIKHCLLLSIATCTCPLYVKPTLLLTEQYSAPYVMAGVISCTVCLYICFGMSHSRIVSCQVDRDFFILLFSYFPAPPMSGNNEHRCLNCFLVWCRHFWSLCRWFGHFLAESYTLFFPVLTIIPSNVCFLSRSCNSKLSHFSCSASRTSKMIINTIGTALVVIFAAIKLFRTSIFFTVNCRFPVQNPLLSALSRRRRIVIILINIAK